MIAVKQYLLFREPRESQYVDLIDWLCTVASRGAFVVRDDPISSSSIGRIIASLHDDIVASEIRSSWPGTQLFGHEALVTTFTASPRASSILKSATTSLFQWIGPDLPEDLHFIRSSNEPLLTTISHEKDAFLSLTDIEIQDLLAVIPSLSIRAE